MATGVKKEIEHAVRPTESFFRDSRSGQIRGYIQKQAASDVMRAAIKIRDEKRFLDYGFSSMDDFLNSCRSPISQGSFYRKLPLFEKEGPVLLTFLKSFGCRSRRGCCSKRGMFGPGKKVFVGDHEIDRGDDPTIVRQIIVRLVDDKLAAAGRSAKGQQRSG